MTIVNAIRELDLKLSITFIADNEYFPYGGRDSSELTKRISTLIEQALDFFEFDAVVIACNTASTVVLDVLRASFSLPFVGVVPAVKTAGEVSQSRVIALLATEGTVRGNYLDSLIRNFASDCRIICIECPLLAFLAEDKVRGRHVDQGQVRAALSPLGDPALAGMDVIVLGCTHYPLLQAELEKEIRGNVRWLDPAPSVARQLSKVIEAAKPTRCCSGMHRNNDIIFFTSRQGSPEDMRPFLKEIGFHHLMYWPAKSATLS
jgi:glutamate racemase